MGLYIAPNPTLCWLLAAARWSGGTKASRKNPVRARGAYANIVEDTFCQYEDEIVDLIMTHKVKRVFFTGHSLGGGLANVAHLAVRGQLALGQADLLGSGSPWTNPKLDKVDWLACTWASPQTIVRLSEPEKPPPLIKELDASSYNIVYGCDIVPRAAMLAFLGNVLEIVVPQIKVNKDEPEDIPGSVKKLFALKKLPLGGNVVEYLKNDGTAYVAKNLTHVGKVLYQRSEDGKRYGEDGRFKEDEEYMCLAPEAQIQKVLDVKDPTAFKKLWGDPDKYGKSFKAAHLHIAKFVPNATFHHDTK